MLSGVNKVYACPTSCPTQRMHVARGSRGLVHADHEWGTGGGGKEGGDARPLVPSYSAAGIDSPQFCLEGGRLFLLLLHHRLVVACQVSML